MPVLHYIRLTNSSLLKIYCVLCVFLTFSTLSASANKSEKIPEKTGRGLLGFLKPKNDYTDINMGLEVPIPQVHIPYPIWKFGYQNLFPFKTWLTINPLDIYRELYKLTVITYEFAKVLWLINWNTYDIFKLWYAYSALHKLHKHGGWPSSADHFEDHKDSWYR